MKYFPYESFYITTSLTVAEVRERIISEINPSSGISFKGLFKGPSNHYFSGFAGPVTFSVYPQIAGRNSFLPYITGKVEHIMYGSRITVTMRLNSGVFAFMCLWIGFTAIAAFSLLYKSIWGDASAVKVLIPMGMMAFGYCMALLGFKSESGDARKKLVSIFYGEVEEMK